MGITVRDKISESSTTSVYRAVDETLGREVLLKVLHRHLAHDEQVRQRFIREARACATLHSEHIVQVFDLRDYEGSPAIVMEFVSGRSLKEIIEEGHQRTFAFAKKSPSESSPGSPSPIPTASSIAISSRGISSFRQPAQSRLPILALPRWQCPPHLPERERWWEPPRISRRRSSRDNRPVPGATSSPWGQRSSKHSPESGSSREQPMPNA